MSRRGSGSEARRIAAVLRKETIGGALLLAATLIALLWANSPWADRYQALVDFRLGPHLLHLNLSLGSWAADGLLAVFFFVAGLELKREFVTGDLATPRRAAGPVAAALGGVIVPAACYLLLNFDGAPQGWAIPTATDIAFALAVLAVAGRFLPTGLRTFLLALAVVDDLLAIVIIAVFYTAHLSPLPLLAALLPLAAFTLLVRRQVRAWWLLLPLAGAAWALVHASGIHATVAGILLGFAVPVRRHDDSDGPGPAEHFEHRFRPLSAGVAVPLFAFFSAGVAIGGARGLTSALTDPVALGVMAGLVVGKPAGILLATWLTARFTRGPGEPGPAWADVTGLALLGGIGFTVSLLIGELAFETGSPRGDHVKIAVLLGSLTAAALAVAVLRLRNRTYRRLRDAGGLAPDRDAAEEGGRFHASARRARG